MNFSDSEKFTNSNAFYNINDSKEKIPLFVTCSLNVDQNQQLTDDKI